MQILLCWRLSPSSAFTLSICLQHLQSVVCEQSTVSSPDPSWMKDTCGAEVAGHTAGMVTCIETFGEFCLVVIAVLGGFAIGFVLLEEGGCQVMSPCVSVLMGQC